MYRFKITIDRTKVTGTNTNFVYLFSEGSSSIPAGFWSHVSDTTNGLDIRFFDTDGTTELKREVVVYSAGTQKVEAWVQIPSLGTATNKEIWCQYGDAPVANSTAVWSDVNYKAVYHLQANGNDSLAVNTCSVIGSLSNVDGKVDKGYSGFGSSNYFENGNDSSIQLSSTGTITAWVNNSSSGHKTVVSKEDFLNDQNGYALIIENGKIFLELADAISYQQKAGSATINDSQWHLIGATWNGSVVQLYNNGATDGSSSAQTITPVSNVYNFRIGRGHPDSRTDFWFDGTLDEVRIASTALDANWVATEYANQNDPATFSSCSIELEGYASSYRFPITIDKTKVSGTHTNFVYMFTESVIGIPGGFWSRVKDTSGLDIQFYDSNGIEELKREIVLFDSVNKKVEAWVQVPSLSSDKDKTIWCVYGGSTVVSSTAVWTDINATGIYHYQNVGSNSTGSTNLSISGATQVDTGKIHKAYSFDGNDSMSMTKAVHSGQYTIALWAYVTGVAPNGYRIVATEAPAVTSSYFFGITDTDVSGIYGGVGWGIARYSGGWQGTYSGNTYASQKDSWHRVVATYDGSKFRIYVDGVLKNTSGTITIPACSSSAIVGQYNSANWMIGIIEQLSYFSNAKSTEWIATEYANQNDPATFSRCGVESNSGETATVLMIL